MHVTIKKKIGKCTVDRNTIEFIKQIATTIQTQHIVDRGIIWILDQHN